MPPSRVKLTITVMSIGLAREAGAGLQQAYSLANTSLRVSSCAGSACADAINDGNSSDAANQVSGLRRLTMAYLMSDATCTFTILSGSVTSPPRDPGGAFLSLSTTSMPDTTSPITVYWPFRLGASANMKKN